MSGRNDEEQDVTPEGVNVEMQEEDAVQYCEDRMGISLESDNIVDINSEDQDAINPIT